MPRILVVFYSRTGRTERLGRAIAERLHADVEAISDPTPRAGVIGYFRSGRQAFARTVVPIASPAHDPADYDLVIVGSPIWNVSLSAPVRSYLRHVRTRLPRVAFFLTCGGMGMDRVFRQMNAESGRTPVATVVLRENEFDGAFEPAVDRFVAAVNAQLPAPQRVAASA